jgi:hypothetical protein
MELPVTAVYDANILYPAPLRDLFIRLVEDESWFSRQPVLVVVSSPAAIDRMR